MPARLAWVLKRLPELEGRSVRVRFAPNLMARRGALLSGKVSGQPVYAGSFLRKRRMVLDAGLLETPRDLVRIFVHEVFHFAWLRAGNATRQSWEAVLRAELGRHARGELGWSAESRKGAIDAREARARDRHWREYACESFCDTAAWLLAGLRRHEEYTLAPRFRAVRRTWFAAFLRQRPIPI